MHTLATALRYWLSDISHFSRLVIRRPLRRYQLRPAAAILQSILQGQGLTFAVMMSRQAGKNELSAQLEAYLLNLYRRRGGGIVKASPTFKPQTVNSILRLTDRLENPWNHGQYRRREGYIIELDAARAFFFSAEPSARVVGATASLLLEGDEAQDIAQVKWDKDFIPMGASTNVTTVLYGTAWTSQTFLAQTIQHLHQLELRDGRRRVFCVSTDEVAAEVPAYGAFVKTQVARLGRNHPLIRTQFFLEPVDTSGGLFPPSRRALMRGSHPPRLAPEPGHRYALLIDVAGEDETEGLPVDRAMLANPRRDATAITIVDVIVDRARMPLERLFCVVQRELHLGTRHTALYGRILALARHWGAAWVVVDATGVGAGLAAFLAAALGHQRDGGKVVPVEFTPNVKSDLGWDFLALVETGRFQDHADTEPSPLGSGSPPPSPPLPAAWERGPGGEGPSPPRPVCGERGPGGEGQRQFWYEVEACQYEITPGPAKRMRWGVWESPAYDGLIARGHDDLLISAALCTIVDKLEHPGDAVGAAVDIPDALQEIDRAGW